MALMLHGIVFTEGTAAPTLDGVTHVAFRDLTAVVNETEYELQLPDDASLRAHHEIIGAVAKRGSVLPAPPGTIFRTRQSLEQWLELHYVALTDALAFVDDRVEARVYVRKPEGDTEERETGTDLAAVAADTFKVLRRQAVASITLRTEHVTGVAIAGAFLVERELWDEFAHDVEEEHRRHDDLNVTLTGPWPPYDFIRMQFGG
jgi:hypothetical protein